MDELDTWMYWIQGGTKYRDVLDTGMYWIQGYQGWVSRSDDLSMHGMTHAYE